MKDLPAWLEQIEQMHPHDIDLGLSRIEEVASRLQVKKFTCPVIMVGGTNGKGSCVKFLEKILTVQGYQVGSYTSPHLLSFNERICFNGHPVADLDLIQAFEQVEAARKSTALTFFEFTTLAALWLFKHQPLEALILEVGLGGRLDAVNIVDADIAIITSIDIDHTDWLGHSREEIGFEKAGIFRKGRPAVIGAQIPPASVLRHAQVMGTPLFCLQSDFSYHQEESSWSFKQANDHWVSLPLPQLPVQNAACALMTLSLLKHDLPVSLEAIAQGIATASLPGRFQRYPALNCILDVAHNEASARLLAKQYRKLNHPGSLIAVVGMLKDKDIVNTLKPLKHLVSKWYFGSLSVARGAQAKDLVCALEDIDNANCYTYDCVTQAFESAYASRAQQDQILVFGSFYTVAQVMAHIK